MITELDEKTALVIIDLQKGITAYAKPDILKNILDNTARLIEGFRKANLPVVIVNVKPGGNAAKTRKEHKPAFNANTPEWSEILPEIKTQPDDIFITKYAWSAFQDTDLTDELRKRGVTGIVLCGISTSIGVEGTARDAAVRGFNVTFATDAMTDSVPESHERSIRYIFPRLGESGTTSEILELLQRHKHGQAV